MVKFTVAAVILSFFAANADAAAPEPEVDYSVKAIVMDKDTGLPLSGAYVALIYRRAPTTTDDNEDGADPLNGACRKVKGGFTGADGAVVIRGGDAEGLRVNWMFAFKNGYFIARLNPKTAPRDRFLPETVGTRFDLIPRGSARAPVGRERDDAHKDALDATSMYSLDCWLANYREDALPAFPLLDMLLMDFNAYYEKETAREKQNDIGRIKHLLASIPTRSRASP